MDVIKTMATEFSDDYQMSGFSLDWYDSELSSKLLYINKTSEKLRFLSYLRDIVETSYKKHAIKCTDPDRCDTNKSLEFALYAIKQQYDDYFEIVGGISTEERPAMKFFSDGQYFDAFSDILEIIKQARTSIILIDGYVTVDTLTFFPSKEPQTKLRILTNPKSIGTELERGINMYNKQNGNLKVEVSNNFHDRFLILDNVSFFHFGASIKDAGNKAFMYTRIEDPEIMQTIRNKVQNEWPGIYE